jgi:lipid A 4'-phosphatase
VSGGALTPPATLQQSRAEPRLWLPEALLLVALALVVSALFASARLDIAAAGLFYRAGSWPLATRAPWSILYGAAPWITASLVGIGIVSLIIGAAQRHHTRRMHAVFLLLSIALGPGLLANFVFKDHWARPRPRDIVEFAGPLQYVPAPLPGRAAGASFPCGHCSVGFLYGAGWWVWKRRRPRWARASLVAGLAAGLALGVGRMAAGAHFLSDVLWSALLTYGVCHVLYYHVLRLGTADAADTPAVPGVFARRHHLLALAGALCGVSVLVALFVSAHGTQVRTVIPLAPLSQEPLLFEFQARAADVDIVLEDTAGSQVSVVGELHGFGLPSSRLAASFDFAGEPVAVLRYRFEQAGWFTDLNGFASVRLPAARFARVRVRLGRGNVTVRDETRAGVVDTGKVALDLATDAGKVTVLGRKRTRAGESG